MLQLYNQTMKHTKGPFIIIFFFLTHFLSHCVVIAFFSLSQKRKTSSYYYTEIFLVWHEDAIMKGSQWGVENENR